MARDDGFVRYTLRIPEALYARVQRPALALAENYPAPAPAGDVLASLRAILPLAESRAEDMLECAEECEASTLKHPTNQGIASNAAEARDNANKAVAAVDAAKALLASLDTEGGARG
ncbi:hypothetical protein DK26_14895 [Bosea sp. WAO]|uniref:hypothetical protein n=1 Tax=Bosea sp. WAO TaxID=406341 RepID=UPI0007496451|nr:hypothetical protein [Bosea sp. WAO]KUL94302.1 hypothetical protein DK26_14895 [Bosea sp. WAO]